MLLSEVHTPAPPAVQVRMSRYGSATRKHPPTHSAGPVFRLLGVRRRILLDNGVSSPIAGGRRQRAALNRAGRGLEIAAGFSPPRPVRRKGTQAAADRRPARNRDETASRRHRAARLGPGRNHTLSARAPSRAASFRATPLTCGFHASVTSAILTNVGRAARRLTLRRLCAHWGGRGKRRAAARRGRMPKIQPGRRERMLEEDSPDVVRGIAEADPEKSFRGEPPSRREGG